MKLKLKNKCLKYFYIFKEVLIKLYLKISMNYKKNIFYLTIKNLKSKKK